MKLSGRAKPHFLAIGALFFVLCFAACDSDSSSSGGAIQTTDLIVGTGAEAFANSSVTVDYVGRLENGSIFDDGASATFNLAQVIPGFRDGIVGMREGGRREIVIPPELAYGPAGIPGTIPGNETLSFDVTLLDVE